MIGYLYNHKNIHIFVQYLVLVLTLFVSALVFTRLSDTFLRFIVIIADSILYVLWGVWHHYHIDRFDRFVFLEYALVSIFIIFLSAMGLGIIRFY